MSAVAEYLAGVDYHLGFAQSAASRCSRALYEFGVLPDHTGTKFYINRADTLDLVRWGDIAVREAASVIEVGWVAINHILDLGLDATRELRWRDNGGKAGLFQSKMRALGTPTAVDLADAIGGMFDSIGYDLLQGYRNWVTHRGAPVLEPSLSVLGPLPISPEVQQESDQSTRAFRLQTEATLYLHRNLRVTCWSIAPPVQMTYSAHIGLAEAPIDLPGIHIGAGASNIHIEDQRIQSGSLWDKAEDFKRRNPLHLTHGSRRVAGEDLAHYGAGDYVMAVRMIGHFAQEAVCQVFDSKLCRAIEELSGPASNN